MGTLVWHEIVTGLRSVLWYTFVSKSQSYVAKIIVLHCLSCLLQRDPQISTLWRTQFIISWSIIDPQVRDTLYHVKVCWDHRKSTFQSVLAQRQFQKKNNRRVKVSGQAGPFDTPFIPHQVSNNHNPLPCHQNS